VYFRQKQKNFAVLWEDDFLKDGQRAIAHALSHAGIVKWKKLGIYEFPDLHPGRLYDILTEAGSIPPEDTGDTAILPQWITIGDPTE
jgi:hypothetical protein